LTSGRIATLWHNDRVRVLVAMSGGVDSSVAAARLREEGHDVVGCTLRLWGGESDAGCCSAADVDDARRVAQVLGIDHHVFNLAERFEADVVAPYVAAHARGETPNPCVECNRSIKFGELLARASRLGFDAVATGHHARVVRTGTAPQLRRGADAAKDQSYVLGILGTEQLARLALPVGELTKAEVRAEARALGLRTAAKPDSQEVCFIPRKGRARFLAQRTALTAGTVVERATGVELGSVPAVQLVTVGQRRGIGPGPRGAARFVTDVDVAAATVYVAAREDLDVAGIALAEGSLRWSGVPRELPASVLVQTSAHGPAAPAVLSADGGLAVRLERRVRPVAPGQLAVFYDPEDPDLVLGAATVARRALAAA
jgi:tRNA-uridine 2-sulfurtransferase